MILCLSSIVFLKASVGLWILLLTVAKHTDPFSTNKRIMKGFCPFQAWGWVTESVWGSPVSWGDRWSSPPEGNWSLLVQSAVLCPQFYIPSPSTQSQSAPRQEPCSFHTKVQNPISFSLPHTDLAAIYLHSMTQLECRRGSDPKEGQLF